MTKEGSFMDCQDCRGEEMSEGVHGAWEVNVV